MNYKESRTNKFFEKNKFRTKIKKSAKQLCEQYSTPYSFREAIQKVKENYRNGGFGVEVGRVFNGNSNKCNLFMLENITNKVQKRNQINQNLKYFD